MHLVTSCIIFLKNLVIGCANDQRNGLNFLFSSSFKINSMPWTLFFRKKKLFQLFITKSIITMLIYISYAYLFLFLHITYIYIYIVLHIIDNRVIIFTMLQPSTKVSFHYINMIFIKVENKWFFQMWENDNCSLNCCQFSRVSYIFIKINSIYTGVMYIIKSNFHQEKIQHKLSVNDKESNLICFL